MTTTTVRLGFFLALACAGLFVTAAAAPAAHAAEGEPEPPEASTPMEFESYTLVLLRRGPSWSAERTPESDDIQSRHLAHLSAMAEAGKLVIAGPFSEQDDESLRGLCLYRAPLGEARTLAEADPAVQAGRLRVEAMTWWTQKGHLAFPKAPPAP